MMIAEVVVVVEVAAWRYLGPPRAPELLGKQTLAGLGTGLGKQTLAGLGIPLMRMFEYLELC